MRVPLCLTSSSFVTLEMGACVCVCVCVWVAHVANAHYGMMRKMLRPHVLRMPHTAGECDLLE